ncbi:D-alanyl-D-alanine carboxypeptidase family protein [Ktedonobacter racemifer]|uniref:Peptidase S11 D-alanyl-D-alanine carboxypeptidase 1 n=1 Tax=Ktedonobacter racemifer DSM 44963 TaxID=485913 RepID=D6TYF3_KTERA|nr:D-alanyl-D-alanine carboxypeptidase family protein [Ktedonobacter racemifer]EFH83233.1 peptidase S11 D-alanyl-D-alanine carboxypeptidase 1 [Ktedonobacter racemifer DSM 44963]
MREKRASTRQRLLALAFASLSGLLTLSIVLFACISTGVIPLGATNTHAAPGTVTPSPTPEPTPIPPSVLTVMGGAPPIDAKAAYLLDIDTGNVLDDQNAEQPLPMASTTKIMTALVVIEAANLKKEATVSPDIPQYVFQHNGSNAKLMPGDTLTINDLLYALMLPSGDDAAIVLARAVAGSSDAFVGMMNRFALRHHLFQTHFINPDGLTYYDANGNPLPGHYSSARDLARLTAYALSNPLFAKIVGTRQYDLAWSPKHGAYHWANTNDLFNLYPATTGVKTGFTNEAGYCLVFSATRDHHHLVGTVLFSSNTDTNQRFRDAKTLLEWGFGLPMLPAY